MNKYLGITIILLALLSISISWMMYSNSKHSFYSANKKGLQTQRLIDGMKINPEQFKTLTKLNEIIKSFTQVKQTNSAKKNIALSPRKPKIIANTINLPTTKDRRQKLISKMCRQANRLVVSMAFIGNGDKYAVISDKFVNQGDRVKGGFQVISILNDSIKVQKAGITCKIKIKGEV